MSPWLEKIRKFLHQPPVKRYVLVVPNVRQNEKEQYRLEKILETLPLAYSGVDFFSGEVEVGVVEEKYTVDQLISFIRRSKFEVESVEERR